MVKREISPYLLLVLLGHLLLLTAAVGSTCVPVQCLRCNATGETRADPCALCSNNTAQCINAPSDLRSNCIKDFEVSVHSNDSKLQEGDDINLKCVHNLPNLNLTFEWRMNGKEIKEGKNKSMLSLKKVLSHQAGQYICFVNSSCGSYKSSPHSVTVENQSVVILVVCGVSALGLVLILGLALKFKLKRDNAKHRERMMQRAREEQASAPPPLTPRPS